MRSSLLRVMVTGLVLLAGACSTSTAPSPDLQGGVLATFELDRERFRVFVTNPTAIAHLFELQRGTATGSIPNGRIRFGSGLGQHNAPHPWHLDPQDIEIVALAIELCDGRPSYVDARVSEYVEVVGRYCPWGARLTALEDYR